ncbi:MAG: hypothetical protein HOE90_08880 [Bacteriovoracaceae bacterium]|jgi:hypothetical protein|nr:hypothetical protein [Bacteriovoracaceae bacterium]
MSRWLIRTKNNHLLGPVSKSKIVELIETGAIKPQDEICSGNGYWFNLNEKDLVDKYVFGDEKQCFNPLSEAKNVLTLKKDQTAVININEIGDQNFGENDQGGSAENPLPEPEIGVSSIVSLGGDQPFEEEPPAPEMASVEESFSDDNPLRIVEDQPGEERSVDAEEIGNGLEEHSSELGYKEDAQASPAGKSHIKKLLMVLFAILTAGFLVYRLGLVQKFMKNVKFFTVVSTAMASDPSFMTNPKKKVIL